MSDGYTKLFSDIVDSSIWDESPETCKVWVTLLAKANADGFVRGSIGWLAGKAKVSVECCQIAIGKFVRPDPHSRTPDFEGRRIEQLDDGWLILNYIAFRDRLSSNPKAVSTRLRVQRHRERYTALRNAPSVTSGHSASASASASDTPIKVETPKSKKPEKCHSAGSRVILHLLNEKSGRHYRETDANLSLIDARLSEPGVELGEVKKMVERQCLRWGADPKMSEYLRPETLFGKTKFDSYYAARLTPANPHATDNRTNGQPNSRNFGIIEGTTDYEALAKQKLEAQDRERESRRAAELAAEMAEDESASSPAS